MSHDPKLLSDVSIDELEALAAGMLIPAAQARLDELMIGAEQHRLSAGDEAELDDLLHKVDQLNLLKARAHYTLRQLGAKASST
jgi:hypothetical protein